MFRASRSQESDPLISRRTYGTIGARRTSGPAWIAPAGPLPLAPVQFDRSAVMNRMLAHSNLH